MTLGLKSPRYVVSNSSPICTQACYASSYLQVRNPVIPGAYELLYTQGGTFPREFPDSDPRGRTSDPIKLSVRYPGETSWKPYNAPYYPHSGTNIVISGFTFPWMWDREYCTSHMPESYIGAVGGPYVYQDDNAIFHCWFTATVGDPYMTTARQFTIYHAISHNGADWTLINYGRKHSNIAVKYAALWFGDFVPAQKYPGERGITSITFVPQTSGFQYIYIQVWTDSNAKNGLLRIYPGGGPDIWAGNVPGKKEWEPIINGEIPDWFIASEWTAGNVFPWIIEQIVETPDTLAKLDPDAGQFTMLSSPDGKAIWYAYSNDAIHWKPAKEVAGSRDMAFNIGSPRLDKSGDLWHFSTVDKGLFTGDPSLAKTPVCGDNIFGGSFICEAEAVYEKNA
jgi:hypothetical protein